MERLNEILSAGRHIVFFGGAGVSTESGIPDFRSAAGLYRQDRSGDETQPEEMLSHSFFLRCPREFFAFYFQHMVHPSAQPSGAHQALAALETMGKLDAVLTQNIDGLHQKAGSRTVLELHGSVLRNHCMECGQFYPLEALLSMSSGVPRCLRCGGVIKPDVVLYEESLDENLLCEARRLVAQADVLLVGGTSLSVYPAAGLLRDFSGRRLVLLNRTPTPYDGRADLVLRGSIGEILLEAVSSLCH